MAEVGVEDPTGLVWQDEMRVGLIGTVRRIWVPKGEKIRQAVEVKYEWLYLNLAVNGVTGTLYWDWKTNMRQEAVGEFVDLLKAKEVTAIVWDGAPGHRAKSVQARDVPLIQQPPYSPELNPAERVFEELRKEIEGQVYGDLAKKQAAVEQVLVQLAADPDRLKSLTGWDWIQNTIKSYPTEKALVN